MRLSVLALVLLPVLAGACSPPDDDVATVTGSTAAPLAAGSGQMDPGSDPALGAAIAQALGDSAENTRLVVRFAPGQTPPLALVYLVGSNWCGSGGCNLLILRQTTSGWAEVGNVARSGAPVRVLATSTNGLPDLGVLVSGGGGPPAYEAKLAFDGQSYPRFPPDEALVGAQGTVVITDADIAAPAE